MPSRWPGRPAAFFSFRSFSTSGATRGGVYDLISNTIARFGRSLVPSSAPVVPLGSYRTAPNLLNSTVDVWSGCSVLVVPSTSVTETWSYRCSDIPADFPLGHVTSHATTLSLSRTLVAPARGNEGAFF